MGTLLNIVISDNYFHLSFIDCSIYFINYKT